MSDDPLYREIILEHWENPQNYGTLDDADIVAEGNNPLCGDKIKLTAKIKDSKISDIVFTADGCAISKASASLFTEFAKGKSLDKLKSIDNEKALDLLSIELTPSRIKCALLPYSTLQRHL